MCDVREYFGRLWCTRATATHREYRLQCKSDRHSKARVVVTSSSSSSSSIAAARPSTRRGSFSPLRGGPTSTLISDPESMTVLLAWIRGGFGTWGWLTKAGPRLGGLLKKAASLEDYPENGRNISRRRGEINKRVATGGSSPWEIRDFQALLPSSFSRCATQMQRSGMKPRNFKRVIV
jgi:hypothetical protein